MVNVVPPKAVIYYSDEERSAMWQYAFARLRANVIRFAYVSGFSDALEELVQEQTEDVAKRFFVQPSELIQILDFLYPPLDGTSSRPPEAEGM